MAIINKMMLINLLAACAAGFVGHGIANKTVDTLPGKINNSTAVVGHGPHTKSMAQLFNGHGLNTGNDIKASGNWPYANISNVGHGAFYAANGDNNNHHNLNASVKAIVNVTTSDHSFGHYGNQSTVVLPQVNASYPNIPDCSKPCFNKTVITDGCERRDAACHCTKTSAFHDSFINCIMKSCAPACQRQYVKALVSECHVLGVNLSVPANISSLETSASSRDYIAAEYPPIPDCSKTCYNNTVSRAGCSAHDSACACGKAQTLQASIDTCVVKECPRRKDQMAYIRALNVTCSSLSIPIPPTSKLTLPVQVKAVKVARTVAPANDISGLIESVQNFLVSAVQSFFGLNTTSVPSVGHHTLVCPITVNDSTPNVPGMCAMAKNTNVTQMTGILPVIVTVTHSLSPTSVSTMLSPASTTGPASTAGNGSATMKTTQSTGSTTSHALSSATYTSTVVIDATSTVIATPTTQKTGTSSATTTTQKTSVSSATSTNMAVATDMGPVIFIEAIIALMGFFLVSV